MSVLSIAFILTFITIMLMAFFSHTKDKAKELSSQAEQQSTLNDLERELRAKHTRQEKTLEEISLYPEDSKSGEPAWLFLDSTVSGSILVEMAWMTTDASGHLVENWHGLPKVDDFEELTVLAAKVKGVVMFGVAEQRAAIAAEMRKANRDDIANSWLQTKTIDICRGKEKLENLLGRLYLEDENAPVGGLDNAEARTLIIYRCFLKMYHRDTNLRAVLAM